MVSAADQAGAKRCPTAVAHQAENLRGVGFARLTFEPSAAELSNEGSGLGFFDRSLCALLPPLSGSGEKCRFDRHLYRQARFLRKAFDGFAKLGVVLQVKSVDKLLGCWVLRNVRPIVNVSAAISEPLKTDCQRLRQFRSDLSAGLATALLVARDLRGRNAADLSQVSLRPAMAGARLDKALWKFAVHFFQI